jgi:hypothetical protein
MQLNRDGRTNNNHVNKEHGHLVHDLDPTKDAFEIFPLGGPLISYAFGYESWYN